ncbi:DUF3514 domain-containing protein [Ehrlichia canis]|uniref:Uncharacterized protein n=1 Tax=Ehrlichia canis (strain Jake) TaxID=269484 RepID=A0ACA6AV46_EHRCJ|nr:DUF3514 domain-containing protein [Ehrlichia canis]AAZ68117.1 hypothetical protein Ecaj_0066 [Ehrlichia canis str. Jake]AUO54374.1 DUF3514 domain-containing protein [Ehrlichia canis]UKC52996.1 DUF3514 domain-containing protein [Ehrlichia canis]UKC53933.1 DUF3514 domain-containing protein [Ehrlichia canis]UKC54869.1 DUF3514 domain-containing protein [Ehrlichia canis]
MLFLAVISIVGSAAAAVLLRLIINAAQNEKNEEEEQKESDKERCVQESGVDSHSNGKVRDKSTMSDKNVRGGKKKRRSRSNKKGIQEIDKTDQDKQSNAGAASSEGMKEKKCELEKKDIRIPTDIETGKEKGAFGLQSTSDSVLSTDLQTQYLALGARLKERTKSVKSKKSKPTKKSDVQVAMAVDSDQVKKDDKSSDRSVSTGGKDKEKLEKKRQPESAREVIVQSTDRVTADKVSQKQDEERSTETSSSKDVKSTEGSKRGLEQKVPAKDDESDEGVQNKNKEHDTKPNEQVDQSADKDLQHQPGGGPIRSASEHSGTPSQSKDTSAISSDVSQASDGQDKYLALGARPKVRTSKPSKSKMPKSAKKPAVQFFDWDSKYYKVQDPVLVQAGKEYNADIKSTSSILPADEESISTLLYGTKVQQKHSESTDAGLSFNVLIDKTSTQVNEDLVGKGQDFLTIQSMRLKESSLDAQEMTILKSAGQRVSDTVISPVETPDIVQAVCDQIIQKDECEETADSTQLQCLKSVKISKVDVRGRQESVIAFDQSVLPSAFEILALASKKSQAKRQALNIKFYNFKMMHLQYCYDIAQEMFFVQNNKLYTKYDLLSFLRLNIQNYELCVFLLKLSYVLNCTIVIRQPTFAKNLVYNASFFHEPSILCDCIGKLFSSVQSGYTSIEVMHKILCSYHVKRFPQNSTLYSGAFFSELLKILGHLVSIRLSEPNYLNKILDFAIVNCSMMLGSMYSNYRYLTGIKGMIADEATFNMLVDHMGSTGSCKGKLGLMCYRVLCNILYMYNGDYNNDVLICGMYLPERVVKQCSQYFSDKIVNNVVNNTMGFHVIMEDISMLICSMIDRFNLAAFEKEIQAYSNLYDMMVRSSGTQKDQGHGK